MNYVSLAIKFIVSLVIIICVLIGISFYTGSMYEVNKVDKNDGKTMLASNEDKPIEKAAPKELTHEELVKKGSRVFNKCKACHTIDKGGKNKVGPNLNGVIGRVPGSKENFKYSDAMKKFGVANGVWTDEAFTKYIANPKGVVPGNKMAFSGLKKEIDVKSILPYIKSMAE